MNLEKADYHAIIQFGTWNDLKQKLQMQGVTLDEIKDLLDKNGMSLLEKSLCIRNFEIAEELLARNVKVNIISNEGCNEFHYIAAHINHIDALKIAKILLKRGVSLTVKDQKYGNSAIFTLCNEVFKVGSDEGLEFLETCLKNIENYDDCNKNGYSLRMLITERGTGKLIQIMNRKNIIND